MKYKHLVIQKTSLHSHIVRFNNGAILGNFTQLEDGFFYYEYQNLQGCLPSYVLKELSEALDQLNVTWENNLIKGLSK